MSALKGIWGRLTKTRPVKVDDQAEVPADLYREQLASSPEPFAVPGLTHDEAQLVLRQPLVEVRLHAMPRANGNGKHQPTPRELAGPRPVWDFLRSDALQEARVILLVGPPGGGKTTLLQHVALTLLTGRHTRFEVPSYLPVLLPMQRCAQPLLSEPSPGLDALIEGYLATPGMLVGPPLPKGWIDGQLRTGRTLVLLDGIDEVEEPGHVQAIVRWLNKQAEAYPGCRFVCTLRPASHTDVRLDHSCTLEVLGLRGEHVRSFLEALFWARAAAPRPEMGRDDPTLAQNAVKMSQTMVATLRTVPSLAGLGGSPLTLSALARLASPDGTLAERKVDILLGLCELLAQGPLDSSLSAEARLLALRALADHVSRSRVRDIKAEDVRKLAAPHLPGAGAVDELLDEARRGQGMLCETSIGQLRFAHPILHEALTALQMRDHPPSGRRLEQLVQDWHWHETLSLYAAQADASVLVQSCLGAGSVQALTLASECLEVAHTLDPVVEAEARAVLVDPLEGGTPRAHKLACEVRLQRRLRGLVRIDEQREIDPEYITCAEYQLFIDEMKQHGHYYQPDHWSSMHFPAGQQDVPVIGVRPDDARDFCVWLNMRLGGARYRLPRPEEARLFPARSEEVAAWCREGNVFNLVGLDRRIEQGILEQLGKLKLLSMPATLPLERSLNHTLDILFNKTVLRLLELQTDAISEKWLIHSLDHVRELLTVRAMELSTVISPDLDLARVLTRCSRYGDINAAVESYNPKKARQLLTEMLADYGAESPEGRFAELLMGVLEAVEAESMHDVQRAQRRYFAIMARWVHDAYGQEDLSAGQRRQKQQGVAEFYVWLQLLLLRAEGEFPVWEGIRLVRDQALATASVDKLDLPVWAYNA